MWAVSIVLRLELSQEALLDSASPQHYLTVLGLFVLVLLSFDGNGTGCVQCDCVSDL